MSAEELKSEFTQVDINTFFNEMPEELEDVSTGLAVLTPKEEILYKKLTAFIRKTEPESLAALEKSMKDLQILSASIEEFPSLLEKQKLTGGLRTPALLIESLIKHQDKGDNKLHLPSKATLGEGFIVAKIHRFSAMRKISARLGAPEELTQELALATITLLFTLMAEDVYLNLIRDTDQPMEYRREWAQSLLLIWDDRKDQTIESIAPVLRQVWHARRKLAPAFGTMMGTSELLLISMQMDEQWVHFVKEKLGDSGVSQAMEEFLFGISYEQILSLRTILKTKGIAAIGRDEVSQFLGEHVKSDAGQDYRDFYSLYTVRRDNCLARQRLKLEGPKKTLEDYFLQFITERNHKLQEEAKTRS